MDSADDEKSAKRRSAGRTKKALDDAGHGQDSDGEKLVKSRIAGRIEKALDDAGYSQSAFEGDGLSQSTLSLWLSGSVPAALLRLADMARRLERSADWFLLLTDDWAPASRRAMTPTAAAVLEVMRLMSDHAQAELLELARILAAADARQTAALRVAQSYQDTLAALMGEEFLAQSADLFLRLTNGADKETVQAQLDELLAAHLRKHAPQQPGKEV